MSKDIRTLLIITFVTVLAWIALDVIHARRKVEIPQEWVKLTTPLDPNLDLNLIEQLKKEKGK